MSKITAIKGFNDVLPSDSPNWRRLEAKLIGVLDSYGFSQIRLPIVEETSYLLAVWVRRPTLSKKRCTAFLIKVNHQLR